MKTEFSCFAFSTRVACPLQTRPTLSSYLYSHVNLQYVVSIPFLIKKVNFDIIATVPIGCFIPTLQFMGTFACSPLLWIIFMILVYQKDPAQNHKYAEGEPEAVGHTQTL